MNLVQGAGVQLHRERDERRTSLAALEKTTSVPRWKISAYECGYARLTTDELDRIERAFNAIDAIHRIIAPCKLDCSDGPALKAAVDAYVSGCWFDDLRRFAAKPPENPAVITF